MLHGYYTIITLTNLATGGPSLPGLVEFSVGAQLAFTEDQTLRDVLEGENVTLR